MLHIIPWVAIFILSIGYLAQIIRIQVHREVRDLSTIGFISLGIGYIILGYEAFLIGSGVFLFKNVLTLLLVLIILGQIWYHRDEEWHDETDVLCQNCTNEMEDNWKYCPDYGTSLNQKTDDQTTV
jgi:predicted membrane channel-forming protein YqfA (hemolysin III family)